MHPLFIRCVVIAMMTVFLSACGGISQTPQPIMRSADRGSGRHPTSPPSTHSTQPPAPAPAAIAPSGSSAGLWSNGQQIPASFLNTAFGATGPFYQQLPSSPQIDSNSDNAMGYYFSGNPVRNFAWIEGDSSQQAYDYNFPIYTASNSDPLVTIACDNRPANCADNGNQIYLPSLAKQGGGSDSHLGVIEPNGTEYDFWMVSSQPPYQNNARISASVEAHLAANGSGTIAPGFVVRGATAGGLALSLGQIYTSELASGSIHHAIPLEFPCATAAWVFPATQVAGTCSNGQGMPLGSRLWWSMNDTQTNALPTSQDMKTILIAMHHYGAFFIDGGGGGSLNGQGGAASIHLESQEPYWIYGNGTDPALNYAINAGWSHITNGSGLNRYAIGTIGGDVNFLTNLKLLAPCITQLLC